jgi:thiamine kinase-like enzyme
MKAASGSRQSAAIALAAMPGLAGAHIVRRLAAGPTNVTWLVEHEARRWVLRLDRPAAGELGLDRENESRVSAAAAATGITPAYAFFDAAAGICLRRFVAGRTCVPEDLRDACRLERLAAVLRRLHGLPPVGKAHDPAAAIRRYAAQVGTRAAVEVAGRALASLEAATVAERPSALCHNDLVAENILETDGQGLILIDWEYAGIGDPWFDLAVVVRHHGLDERLARIFLEAYLERVAAEDEIGQLERQCTFYGSLLQLWNMRTGNPRPGAGFV